MRRALLAGMLLALIVPSGAGAAVRLDPVGTFSRPVYVTSLPNEPDRLLVVEQRGTIQLLDHGVASTFLDLDTPGLVSAIGEQGLLSVAPAPDYASSRRLYVFYTRTPDGALVVDEFTAQGDSAPLSSRRPLLVVPHPGQTNHNGGQLQFGPDGLLYISTGDGGGAGDQPGNAQSLGTRLGKILRIDPNPAAGAPYTIPATNPFAGSPTVPNEIWSYGLRNPWRFAFDRLTGDLLLSDVGQSAREEVNLLSPPDPGRGANFGWNCREGLIEYSSSPPSCEGLTGFVDPIFDYDHAGGACAIVGGYVVRDSSLGDLYGRYLFTDSCGDAIRSLVPASPRVTDVRSEGLTVTSPSSFGEDACGRVYVTSFASGEVARFVGDAPADCSSVGPSEPAPRCGGEPATRVAAADGSVRGSPAADVIVADGKRNKIKAGRGHDVICALGGRDTIRAGRGDDRIRGGHGKDECIGGRGDDRTRSC